MTSIAPWIAVSNAHEAVEFYRAAFGATEIGPVAEGHGWLVGRLEDPFGHHWEVGKPLPGGPA
jgi:uncharacterized glyoxalase superfamily protein PhnB